MRIALIGGTGKTGRILVSHAIDREWGVRLLAREPDAVPEQPGLQVEGGDVLDPGPVYRTLAGCNAVVLLLGLTKHNPPDVVSGGTRIVTQVMKKLEIPRIVAVSTIGVGPSIDQAPLLRKIAYLTFRKKALADREAQETIIRDSGLEWTIVRPAVLTDDSPTGQARVGTDTSTGTGKVSREDLAAFVLDELEKRNFLHKAVYIT